MSNASTIAQHSLFSTNSVKHARIHNDDGPINIGIVLIHLFSNSMSNRDCQHKINSKFKHTIYMIRERDPCARARECVYLLFLSPSLHTLFLIDRILVCRLQFSAAISPVRCIAAHLYSFFFYISCLTYSRALIFITIKL